MAMAGGIEETLHESGTESRPLLVSGPGRVQLPVGIAPGESLFGFMARVAERNAYDRSVWLLDGHASRRQFDTATWTAETVAQVASITGIDEAEVASRIYADAGEGTQLFFGHALPSEMIVQSAQKSTQRYCPACLAASGVHHAIFDLDFVRVCPFHARRVADSCPDCGRPILWGRPSVTRCTLCGGDLTSTATETVDDAGLDGLRALVVKIGLVCSGPIDTDGLEVPSELAHLSLAQLVELMLGLASYLDGKRAYGSFFRAGDEVLGDQVHVRLSIGWRYLRTWPEGFTAFLDDYRATRGGADRRFGAQRAFGPFYNYVRMQAAEPWSTVRALFTQYLETGWNGLAIPRASRAPDGTAFAFRPRDVPLAEVARLLGRTTVKVQRLVDLGLLTPEPVGTWWGAPIFVSRSEVEAIAPGGRAPLRLDQVGAMLGLPRQRQRQFSDGGLLVPVLGPHEGSKVYLFKATDADELLAAIAAHVPAVAAGKDVKTRGFVDVMKGARGRGLAVKAVVDAMRSGDLPAIGVDETAIGLNRFVFGERRSRLVLDRLEAGRSLASGTALSAPAAAAVLGVTCTVVYSLLKDGHLTRPAERGDGTAGAEAVAKVRGVQVDTASIPSFMRRYAFTSRLAKAHGTSTRRIRDVLAADGLEPIECGKRLNDTSFYAREQLERRDVAALLAAARAKA